MSEDRSSVRSSVCPYVRPSVSPLSVCQPGPFVRPLNKEGTAHNESQYWQANSNACNDSGQRRRLIRAERQPQSQGFIRWTVDSGHWTVDSRPWTVDGGHGTSTMGRPSETKQIKSPGRRVAQWLTIFGVSSAVCASHSRLITVFELLGSLFRGIYCQLRLLAVIKI